METSGAVSVTCQGRAVALNGWGRSRFAEAEWTSHAAPSKSPRQEKRDRFPLMFEITSNWMGEANLLSSRHCYMTSTLSKGLFTIVSSCSGIDYHWASIVGLGDKHLGCHYVSTCISCNYDFGEKQRLNPSKSSGGARRVIDGLALADQKRLNGRGGQKWQREGRGGGPVCVSEAA